MSDSIGGVVNLCLIIFFMVVIALYMAFNVNYQKAFNVKNRIIELYEEYDGKCINNTKCVDEIINYEKKIGYGTVPESKVIGFCGTDMHYASGLNYCHDAVEVNKATDGVEEAKKTCYFEVKTFVEIDIPVINNLLALRMFQVTGQTKQMKIEAGKTCNSYIGVAP